MTAINLTESKPYRIAKKLYVQFSYSTTNGFEAAWTSEHPPALKGALLKRYLSARDEFLQLLAKNLGGDVVLLDA